MSVFTLFSHHRKHWVFGVPFSRLFSRKNECAPFSQMTDVKTGNTHKPNDFSANLLRIGEGKSPFSVLELLKFSLQRG